MPNYTQEFDDIKRLVDSIGMHMVLTLVAEVAYTNGDREMDSTRDARLWIAAGNQIHNFNAALTIPNFERRD